VITVQGDPRTVQHTVTVRHAVTQAPVPGVVARLVPPTPWWWAVAAAPGAVVLHAQARFMVPDPDLTPQQQSARQPVVQISVADPLVAATLTNATTELTVTADVVHELAPVPQTVTVVVTTKTLDAAPGHAVRLVPNGQPPIDVPALADAPGSYRTPTRTWAAGETPFELQIDTQPTGTFALEPFQTDTRLHAALSA
jgi:hypothetical protein